MIVNAYAAVTARRPPGQSGDIGHHACIRRPPRHRPADRNVPMSRVNDAMEKLKAGRVPYPIVFENDF